MATIPSIPPHSKPLRIMPQTPRDLENLLAKERCRERAIVDKQWQEVIVNFVSILDQRLNRFSGDLAAIEMYELENDYEEIPKVLRDFKALIMLGVRFDPSFIDRMNELRALMFFTEADPDVDMSDESCLDDGFGAGVPYCDLGTAFGMTNNEDD